MWGKRTYSSPVGETENETARTAEMQGKRVDGSGVSFL